MLNKLDYTVELEVFSGPLDLLLQLIEREELDITKVALAKVTDQYLMRVRELQNEKIDNIADFLVIAARLILIKSEALLPRPPERQPEEEDPGEELARLLLAYKRYKEVAGILDERQNAGLRTYLRMATPPKPDPKTDLSGITPDHLWQAVARLMELLPADTPPVSTVIKRPRVRVKDKMKLIRDVLKDEGKASFFELLKPAKSRSEIFVTFLAILELVKQRFIEANQNELFDDIDIVMIGDWAHRPDLEIRSELDGDDDDEDEFGHVDLGLKH